MYYAGIIQDILQIITSFMNLSVISCLSDQSISNKCQQGYGIFYPLKKKLYYFLFLKTIFKNKIRRHESERNKLSDQSISNKCQQGYGIFYPLKKNLYYFLFLKTIFKNKIRRHFLSCKIENSEGLKIFQK